MPTVHPCAALLITLPLVPHALQEAAGEAGTPHERALASGVSEERAAKTVRELVALGPRMGGTPSGDAAVELRVARMKALGLEVEVVIGDEQWCHWEDSWSVTAHPAEGDPLPLTSAWPYGFSPSVKGRARLVTTEELGEESAEGLALLGARTPRLQRTAPKPEVALVDGYSTADGAYPGVRGIGRRGPGPYPAFGIGSKDGEALRALLALGAVELEYELVSHIEQRAPRTVIARLPAREGAVPGYLLYCAHGDSDAGGPGANDNGSGEAVVHEIAAAWAEGVRTGAVPPPPREIRFAIWGTEIASTRRFLRDVEESGPPILGVINYDQAGYGSSFEQLNVEPDDLPANRAMIRSMLSALEDFAGTEGFPERWATNKSLGGTDSYVFSGSRGFRDGASPP